MIKYNEKKIICWLFGHRVGEISRPPDYFIKSMIVICSRCGYKENIIHKLSNIELE